MPHNVALLKTFNCHINVEVAATTEILAYLYKYIYKGPDLAYFRFSSGGNQPVDEIKEYICSRGLGASESSWRTLGYHINRSFPAVSRLEVNLQG